MLDISRGQNGGFRREAAGDGGREWLGDFIGGVNASPARILIKSNSRLRKLATGSTVKWNNVGYCAHSLSPPPFSSPSHPPFFLSSNVLSSYRRCETRRIYITTARRDDSSRHESNVYSFTRFHDETG